MYGDDSGNIAWWASAKLPVRPAHVDTKTAIDGTDSTNDPTGWYPFAFNPQSVNPPSGYVYSANNAPDSVKGVYHPGHYYSGNTRGAGIIGAIEAKDDWTLADAQALQLDHHSPVYTRNCAMLVALADASNETFHGGSLRSPRKPPELGRQPHGGTNGTHPVLPVDVSDHTGRHGGRIHPSCWCRSRRKIRDLAPHDREREQLPEASTEPRFAMVGPCRYGGNRGHCRHRRHPP